MAGWITVFGVSASSLTGFACSLGFLASCFGWALIARLSGGRLAAGLGTAVIVAAMLQRGLRPEPLAMLCFLAGQWLLLSWRTPAGWFAGGLLNSAAVLAHPIWMTLVIPATILQVVNAWRVRQHLPAMIGFLLAGIAVIAAALVTYLGRDFPAFLHDISAHAQFVRGDAARAELFVTHLGVGYELHVRALLLVLALGATLVAARQHRRLLGEMGFALALMLAIGVALYAAQTTVYLVLCLAILPLFYPRHGLNRWLGVAPAMVLACWFALQAGLQAAGDRQSDDRDHRPGIAAYLAKAKPDLVGFDATTLRWQFDYRPPPGGIDLTWAWSPGQPDRFWNPREIGRRDVWVINPAWFGTHLPASARRGHLELGRHVFHSVRSSRACLIIVGADLPAPDSIPFVRPAEL